MVVRKLVAAEYRTNAKKIRQKASPVFHPQNRTSFKAISNALDENAG
jgi:hypothetical protein